MLALAAAGVEALSNHFSSMTTLERVLLMPVSAVLNASLRAFLRLLSGLPAAARYGGLRANMCFMSLKETTLGDPLLLVQYSIHILSNVRPSAKFSFLPD